MNWESMMKLCAEIKERYGIKPYQALLLRPWYSLTYQEQQEASEQAYALGMRAARDRLIASKRPGATKGPTRRQAAKLYLRYAEAPPGFRPADWESDWRVVDFLIGWMTFRKLFLEFRDKGIVW